MARRQYVDDDLAEFAAFQQRGDPRMEMAMALLKMGMGQEQEARQEGRLERQAEADRLLRERDLVRQEAGERRLSETLAEGKRSDEAREKTRVAERIENLAREDARHKIEDTAKEAALAKQKKDEAVDALDKMVARGIIGKEEATARYEQLDPEQAAIAKGIKAQTEEKAFKTGLEQYRKLSPKDQARATAVGIGGGSEEVLRRIRDAVQGYTYEPGGPSAMPGKIGTFTPQLEPAVAEPPMRVGYGQAAVEAPPAYSYATRAPQNVPPVGGMTGPVNMSPIAGLQNKLVAEAMYNPAGVIDLAKRVARAPSPVDFRNIPNTISYLDRLFKQQPKSPTAMR